MRDRSKLKSWLFTTLHRVFLGWKQRRARLPHCEIPSVEGELPVITPAHVDVLENDAIRDTQPWQTVQGIEFRSFTVEAFKGKQGNCFDFNQAVIYHNPFREVLDDGGHRLRRGERVAVCDKTFQRYPKAPYAEWSEFIEPHVPGKPEEAKAYHSAHGKLRHPRETKGMAYSATTEAATCCDGGNGSHC